MISKFGFLLLDVLGYKIKRPHDISELLEWISKREMRLQSEITTAFKPQAGGPMVDKLTEAIKSVPNAVKNLLK